MHKAPILRKLRDQLFFFPTPTFKEKPELGNRLWKDCLAFILLFLTPTHTPGTGAKGSLTLRQTRLGVRLFRTFRSRGGQTLLERFLTLPTFTLSLSAGADQLITPFPPPRWPRVIKEKTGNRPIGALGLGRLITIIIITICNQVLKTTTNPKPT